MSRDTTRIEIDFPLAVEFPPGFENKLIELISSVTRYYEREHPDRVMWAAGMGDRPSGMWSDNLTFDSTIYSIEVAERENFEWPCKKCGYSQGNHEHLLLGAPAGTCAYLPADKPYLNWRGFYSRMLTPTTYRSKVRRRARMRRYKGMFTRRKFRAIR